GGGWRNEVPPPILRPMIRFRRLFDLVTDADRRQMEGVKAIFARAFEYHPHGGEDNERAIRSRGSLSYEPISATHRSRSPRQTPASIGGSQSRLVPGRTAGPRRRTRARVARCAASARRWQAG
ncbi:MAG: hypothetical protein KY397_02200, partial [Gemmatimonadetes bacterium]|nr:hypothetical protein [Gemmatimonadota bacterium]